MLMLIGALLLLVGALWYFFPGALSWFGRLPGDIRYQSGNVTVFFPIVSLLIVSLLLNLLFRIFGGFK